MPKFTAVIYEGEKRQIEEGLLLQIKELERRIHRQQTVFTDYSDPDQLEADLSFARMVLARVQTLQPMVRERQE